MEQSLLVREGFFIEPNFAELLGDLSGISLLVPRDAYLCTCCHLALHSHQCSCHGSHHLRVEALHFDFCILHLVRHSLGFAAKSSCFEPNLAQLLEISWALSLLSLRESYACCHLALHADF